MVSFTLRPLYPRETAPGTHRIGWVGLRASLDAVEKINIFPLLGIQPAHNVTTVLTELSRISGKKFGQDELCITSDQSPADNLVSSLWHVWVRAEICSALPDIPHGLGRGRLYVLFGEQMYGMFFSQCYSAAVP
jgi:hypothetical protein